MTRTNRLVRRTTFGAALVLAGLGAAACSSNSTGSTATTTTKAPAATNHLSLTAADSAKTFSVEVPATITLTLPYRPASKDVWQLASGGAGFSQTAPSTYIRPTGSSSTGSQVFHFSLKAKSSLPIVVYLGPPGPFTTKPVKVFRATLHGM
jgi:hypothetical protein